MQEIFFTLLIIWILFRVLNSAGSGSRTVYFTQNNYHPGREEKKEGDIKITYIPKEKSGKAPDEGDYTDFEEIK